jgi:WD40 repeat protein
MMFWKAHQREILSLVLTPDTTSVISGDRNGLLVQWNSHTGEQQNVIHQPYDGANRGGIYKLAFSPDGSRLAVMYSVRGELEIYDTNTWKLQCVAQNADVYSKAFYDFSWHPNGKYVAIAAHGIHIVDSQNGVRIATPYFGHDSATYCLSYTPDGMKLVSGGDEYDHSLALWDANTFQPIARIYSANDESVEVNLPFCVLHVTNQDVVIHDTNILCWNWNTATLSRPYSFGRTRSLLGASIDTSGTLLAHEINNGEADLPHWQSASSDWAKVHGATVKVIDLRNNQTIHSFGGYKDNVRALVFSPDSKHLFTGDGQGFIRVWEI